MKSIRRFPRMEGVTSAVKLSVQILRTTYNGIARNRSKAGGTWMYRGYDIYKAKLGIRAPFFFTTLSMELLKRKIDPALYLKMMCNYGKFEHVSYMPGPAWLADEETIKKFEWIHKKERNKYELDEDWQRSKRGFREKDIYSAILFSANFVQHAQKNFDIREVEAVIMMVHELSPWFISAYLGSTTEKVCDMLIMILKNKDGIYKPTMECMNHFRKNTTTWDRARKVLNSALS